MSVAAQPLFAFEATYAHELGELVRPWQGAPVPAPELLALNEDLAAELGLAVDALHSPEGVAILAGNAAPPAASPVAQAYAGHQFGGYSPLLGDGRALLLGELVDTHGRRRDLHLKGSGPTPFARQGDGRAAVGPMLREHVIGEAMHALGIPTTRALAVTATGARIMRDTPLPGAVLARVAASHLRVGTFEYARSLRDPALLRRLADYAISRHYPYAANAQHPYLALFAAVAEAQASLVARWMLVGFVHGVMNTDNVAISGETIDYGPCAFMDAYDPATVFSSIDAGGRYAFGNQPMVAQWNLARFAESLLGLIDEDATRAVAAATPVLDAFPERFEHHWRMGMRAKLGLEDDRPGDDALIDDLLAVLYAQRVDYTSLLRALSAAVRGDPRPARALFADPSAFDAWHARWHPRVTAPPADPRSVAAAMDRVNPIYVPRNHLVEDALAMATAGDLAPFQALLGVLARPFDERPGLAAYAAPAPAGDGPFRTFCGT